MAGPLLAPEWIRQLAVQQPARAVTLAVPVEDLLVPCQEGVLLGPLVPGELPEALQIGRVVAARLMAARLVLRLFVLVAKLPARDLWALEPLPVVDLLETLAAARLLVVDCLVPPVLVAGWSPRQAAAPLPVVDLTLLGVPGEAPLLAVGLMLPPVVARV